MKLATLLAVLGCYNASGFVCPAGVTKSARSSAVYAADPPEQSPVNEPDAIVADVKKRDWRAFRAQLVQQSMKDGDAPVRKWAPGRYALPIGKLERGCVLLANEKMEGPFWQSVVLIIEHNFEGTIGIVLNKPTRKKIANPNAVKVFEDFPLYYGGPVDPTSLIAVHNVRHADNCIEIAPNLRAGGFKDLVHGVITGLVKPRSVLLAQGYSGWQPGQLKTELDANYWILASIAPEMIIPRAADTTYMSKMWQEVLELMGEDYALIAKRNSA